MSISGVGKPILRDAAMRVTLADFFKRLNIDGTVADFWHHVHTADLDDERLTIFQNLEQAYSGPTADNILTEAVETSVIAAFYMLLCPQTAFTELWSQISRAMIRTTVGAVAQRSPDGFRICWHAAELYFPGLQPDLRRRDALEIHRVYPHEFWPKHRFFGAANKVPCRVRFLRNALVTHPGHTGPLSSLIASIPTTYTFAEGVRLELVHQIDRSMDLRRIENWDVFFVGQALLRLDEPWRAAEALSTNFTLEMPDLIRFEIVVLLAHIASKAFGRLPRLRFLVTALRIMPHHVSAPALLATISRLVEALPDIRRTTDPITFSENGAEILDLDDQIDVSPRLQRWLVFSEYLRESEQPSAFDFLRNRRIDRTELLPTSTAKSRDLPSPKGAEVGSDPWCLIAQTAVRTHIRRSVVLIKSSDVYFKTSATHTVAFRGDGCLLAEASSGQSSFFRLEQLKRPEAIHYDGDYLSLCVAFGHSNYSHFLLDRVPRLAHISDWHLDKNFIVDAEAMAWTEQIFAYAGSEAKLHPIERDKLYHFDSVTLYGKAQHPAQRGHPFYTDFFRSFVPDWAKRRGKRRILIHRDRGRRGVDNQEEFYDLMAEIDFEIIRLEALTIIDQLALFSESEIVVAVHGAGLSNIVACKPGTKVIEILPYGYYTHTFSIIAQSLCLAYFPYLEVSDVNKDLAKFNQYSDTRISIDCWKAFLVRCMATNG